MSDVVLAATDRPLPVRVARIDDDRVPEGLIGLASYLGGRLIARCAVPPETAEFIEGRKLLEQPVQLVLAAREEPPGLQCRLFAVVEVDEETSGADAEPEEPWAASVPKFEDAITEPEESDESPTQGMIFLGQIVRLSRDRKHPESLALETADVLRAIVEGKAGEVVDRVLDDLLDGPELP
jgi:hypothetical protein